MWFLDCDRPPRPGLGARRLPRPRGDEVGGEHLDLERGAVRLRADRVLARRARVRLGPGRGREREGEGPAAAAHARVFGPVGRGRLARLLVLGRLARLFNMVNRYDFCPKVSQTVGFLASWVILKTIAWQLILANEQYCETYSNKVSIELH